MSQATARPGRRTQAERRAATEQRVLDAAVALTAERGVRAVTLATVGEKAGDSRGIVTHHFGSRRALLDALVGRLQDAFRPPAASAGTGLDRLLALVDAYLVHLDAEPEIARAFLVLWVESLAAEPELRPGSRTGTSGSAAPSPTRCAPGPQTGASRRTPALRLSPSPSWACYAEPACRCCTDPSARTSARSGSRSAACLEKACDNAP